MSSFTGEKSVKMYLTQISHPEQLVLTEFLKSPNKYINNLEIDFPNVIMEVLSKDKQYLQFKSQFFPYEKSFNNITLFSNKGSAKIVLNETQKEFLIKKFNANPQNRDVVNSKVEELYVLNSLDVVDSLFPKTNENCKRYIEMFLNLNLIENKFAIFSYNLAFDKENFKYIDSRFKTSDGNDYKSILLFWDSEHELHLTNDNLVKNREKKSTNEINRKNVIIRDKFANILINDGYIKINKKNLIINDNQNYELRCPDTYKFSLYSNNNKFVKQVSPNEITMLVKQLKEKDFENNLKKKNDLDVDMDNEIEL